MDGSEKLRKWMGAVANSGWSIMEKTFSSQLLCTYIQCAYMYERSRHSTYNFSF